jgi:hypothetical protein
MKKVKDASERLTMPLITELVKAFPSFANILPSFLALPRHEIISEFFLKMDISELHNRCGLILETPSHIDADSMIQRFIACESRRGILLHEILTQGVVGFSKTKRRFGDEVLAVLNKCFLKVEAMSLAFSLKVVHVVISRKLIVPWLPFFTIFDD